MKQAIRIFTLSSFIFCLFTLSLYAQSKRPEVCEDMNFNQAYHEFIDMLEGKMPLSVKRGVFLIEWAYLDGKPDYDQFCQQIDSVSSSIREFITVNHLDQIPTGKNVAIFEYFVRPYPMNGNKPFTYDFNDIAAQENFTNYFVTKVMRTHSGQCRSLPMYYKILADEISAEAHITLAPQHLFIRHRHESDPNQWRNVELTTQSLSREIFYIEHFGITDEMIRNKVYMNPLSDRETVAYLLSELALGYMRKYQKNDDFVISCSEKSLDYFPQNVFALINRCNALNLTLMAYLASNGNIFDQRAESLNNRWLECNGTLQQLGYREMNDETYMAVLNSAIQSMKEQGMSEEEIKTKKVVRSEKSNSPKRNMPG